MKTMVKAKRIGGSIMVTIPRDIVEKKSIREGSVFPIEVGEPETDLFGAFKGLKIKKEHIKASDFD